MKLFLFAMFTVMSEAQQPLCYSGTIIVDGQNVTKDIIMGALGPIVKTAVTKTINKYPEMKEFMESAGTCQFPCFGEVVRTTYSTLFGKLGNAFLTDEGKDMEIEAVTGAFRACYPSPPRDEILALASEIVEASVVSEPPESPVPEGVFCENQDFEDDFPSVAVRNHFKMAFRKIVARFPTAQQFFHEQGLDCQFQCLDSTVSQALKTLWLTNRQERATGISALTGSMHACFPGVPAEEIRKLVDAVTGVLEDDMAAATSRLYVTKLMRSLGGGNSFLPLCAVVTAISLMLFSIGVAVGRRMHRSSFGKVSQTEPDQRALIIFDRDEPSGSLE